MLEAYHLTPAPFVIELDKRSDTSALQTLLERFTGRRTVPNILLDFETVGGSDDIALLHAEGGLHRKFLAMNVLPRPGRRRPPKVERDMPDEKR